MTPVSEAYLNQLVLGCVPKDVHQSTPRASMELNPSLLLYVFILPRPYSQVIFILLPEIAFWALSSPSLLCVIDGIQMQERLRADVLAAYNAVSARLIDSSTLTSGSSCVIPNHYCPVKLESVIATI